jgi:lipopolysaccharide/colanic/teichoic acid biosynthesis glycosyltransferase
MSNRAFVETKTNATNPSDVLKRVLDISVSLGALLISIPILVIAAVLVKINAPGPVLYRGIRAGRNGKPFRILKLRTMVIDAELKGGSATAGDDPRLTPIGRFLRRYKFDELPQFFNVLVGDMSLVGPRPAVEQYTRTPEERAILSLKPGITDWASIWNSHEEHVLDGSPDPQQSYEELIHPTKTELQLLYLRNHTIGTDLKILFHTAAKLFDDDWCPRDIKPFGKLQTYKMRSQLLSLTPNPEKKVGYASLSDDSTTVSSRTSETTSCSQTESVLALQSLGQEAEE